jgi:predicted RNA binding protein YcfA (HicA-like mRNA interferase family)
MPRLNPEKPGEVIRKLRKLGYDGPLGGGKHVFMRHPQTHKKIPVPVHGNRDLPIGTLRAIIRQAEVSVEAWLKL